MAEPFKYHMVSPPLYVFDAAGHAHTCFGWRETRGAIFKTGVLEPIVGNPDGPGIGPWSNWYGDDPWSTS